MLTYNDELALDGRVGVGGHSPEDLELSLQKLRPTLEQIIEGELPEPGYAFLRLPDDEHAHQQISELADSLKPQYNTLLVLGIGGSDLGARAVYSALGDHSSGMRLLFAGGNTDPEELTAIIKQIDWRETIINVISKSGETIETMSAFLICLEAMGKAVGEEQAKKQVVATTGQAGTLRDLANSEGYATLEVPDKIGGRFSVLSSVGLFPLACAGIDTAELLDSAANIRDQLKNDSANHPAVRLALHHHVGLTIHKQSIAVLMPYAEALRQFGFWFRQLWAESLGKETKGQTPIAALGATDQHSQIQLYIEGPHDKFITFIVADKMRDELIVPNKFSQYPALTKIANQPLQKLLQIEQKATALALADHHRPNGTIQIDEISPASVGELIITFEIACALMGKLMGINAFNQPGVEYGKKNIDAMLG